METNIPERKNKYDYFKTFGLLDEYASLSDLEANSNELHKIINEFWEQGNHTNEKAQALYLALAKFYVESFYKSLLNYGTMVEIPVNYTEEDIEKVLDSNKDIVVQKSLDLAKGTLDNICGINDNFEIPTFGSTKQDDIRNFDPTLLKDYTSSVHRKFVEADLFIQKIIEQKRRLENNDFIEIRKGESVEYTSANGTKKTISL